MDRAIRLTVSGRVQGVGYRAWCVRKANRLHLVGWVRNRRGGAVEVLARGTEAALDELAAVCRDGPPFAAVERVDRENADPAEAGVAGFRQKDTV